MEDVKNNVQVSGYPNDKIKLEKGKVESIPPQILPDKIILSDINLTIYELEFLYLMLMKKGVDNWAYFYLKGAKKDAREVIFQKA